MPNASRPPGPQPTVSIVICTRNRADSLSDTLESCRFLGYSSFEVIVVAGPCTDHTDEVVRAYEGMVKLVRTEEQNLSSSRNLGIAASAGQIVSFIDDDAIPDGMWLDDLIDVFDDPEVAATGGPVFDHTGHDLQARYSVADRWGDAHIEVDPRRLDHLQRPDTWYFPYTIGTNALFRRDCLVEVGGFDENFAFYLDDTDVCLRLIERGYLVVPHEQGVVHHKFLPSRIRNQERITVDRQDVLASRLYFALRHGSQSNEIGLWLAYADFVERHRLDLAAHVDAGRVPSDWLEKFDRGVGEARRMVTDRLDQPPRTKPPEWFDRRPGPLLPFPITRPNGRRLRLGLVTRDYVTRNYSAASNPSDASDAHALAVGLARAGHLVHVITPGPDGHSTVDFEDGAWVHRIVSSPRRRWRAFPALPALRALPGRDPAAHRSFPAGHELRLIEQTRRVDGVICPERDIQQLAVDFEGHPLIAACEDGTPVDQAVLSIEAVLA